MGIRTYDSEVSQSTDPQPGTLERSSKRRRIESSPPAASTMDFWGVSSDDPAAMISPVPIDPWIVSELGLQSPPDGFVLAEQADTVNHTLDIGNALLQQNALGSFSPSIAPRRPSTQYSNSSRRYETRVSPFVDCRNAFYALPLRKFKLPDGGSLDTYLKFNRGPVSKPSAKPVRRTQMTPDDEAEGPDIMLVDADSDPFTPNPYPSSLVNGAFTEQIQVAANTPGIDPMSNFHNDSQVPPPASLGRTPQFNASVTSPLANGYPAFNLLSRSIPRQPPPFSSPIVSMDNQGMRLWEFYQLCFIPGRTILVKTNLWQHFGGLVEIPSVLSAIQSYMGLYVYDFTQALSLARRINREFSSSEERFSVLLATTIRDSREDSELITLAIIMALQDAILPERRRKLPHQPRWLQCNLLAEEVLNKTYSGMRLRKLDTIQLTPLQTAHTVMVGRALILSECMVELKLPTAGDLTSNSNRFQWLLYGNADEIHGGCGFSRRLLHTVSTITRMAACHAMSPDSNWPRFAEDVLRGLQNLTQVNPDVSRSYVSVGSQPIHNIRNKPPGYLIRSREEMTEVSAEAWRIAIIAYLQCRFWRLPRNHPEVVATITDLADCIRILPTFGSVFTAQAPLLPVFFLGLLGTANEHRAICQRWMSGVLRTASRSSVPPLYQALTNIWRWISEDPRTTPLDPEAISSSPSSRDPWWEYLVSKVQNTEQEILYVT